MVHLYFGLVGQLFICGKSNSIKTKEKTILLLCATMIYKNCSTSDSNFENVHYLPTTDQKVSNVKRKELCKAGATEKSICCPIIPTVNGIYERFFSDEEGNKLDYIEEGSPNLASSCIKFKDQKRHLELGPETNINRPELWPDSIEMPPSRIHMGCQIWC